MEMAKQRLIAVVSASVVIFCVGLYLFLYRPLKVKLIASRLQAAVIEKDLLEMRRVVDYFEENPVRRVMITEAGLSLAMDEITQDARQKGIGLISIIPAQQPRKSEPGGHKILSVDIEAESTYADFGIFLGALDEIKNSVVTVEGFSVCSHEDSAVNLHSKLMLNIYLSE